MPCFSCKCFSDGRGRNGEHLSGGRGYCELWDQEYYRGHECRDFAPVWYGKNTKGSSLKEPSGCFLSSACVEYMGLSDDCRELTVLRDFRDYVLKATKDGCSLVEEYYQIAPQIVEKINKSCNKDEIYKYIYDKIQLCVDEIESRNYENAVMIYKAMADYVAEKV